MSYCHIPYPTKKPAAYHQTAYMADRLLIRFRHPSKLLLCQAPRILHQLMLEVGWLPGRPAFKLLFHHLPLSSRQEGDAFGETSQQLGGDQRPQRRQDPEEKQTNKKRVHIEIKALPLCVAAPPVFFPPPTPSGSFWGPSAWHQALATSSSPSHGVSYAGLHLPSPSSWHCCLLTSSWPLPVKQDFPSIPPP